MKFEGEEFKEFAEYVMAYWRPATEVVIRMTETATIYNWMCEWFSFLDDPNINEILDNCKIDVELYLGIHPYAKHFIEEKDGEKIYEFLFLYDSINIKKITKNQLSLGRSDFIDLEPIRGCLNEYKS